MPFDVQIPEAAHEKIRGWGLSRDFTRRVFEAIRDHLAHCPAQDLGFRITAPIRCVLVKRHLIDPASGDEWEFLFWVNDTQQPGVRYLLDATYR